MKRFWMQRNGDTSKNVNLITKLMFISFMVIIIVQIQAQNGVELYGYFESQIMGAKIKNNFNQLYTNKLRVDLKYNITENITFAGNFDYITYHGKTQWNILDFLTPAVTSAAPEGMEAFYILPFSDQNFLDNAYIKFSLKHIDLTIGKQQISLGTGYVWNPMDVFNIKDPVDPTYEQPGHNALRLDIPLGSIYTMTTLYSPKETWRDSDKLIQLKGRISHFDISLIAIEKLWRFHDYTQIDLIKGYFLELPEKRHLLGISTAGELLGFGVWAEYGYNNMEKSDDFYELVAGLDYTFDFQTYVMMEFYRNTLGKTNYKQFTLNDWMRLLATEQKAISRDQMYFFIQHPVSDFISLGMSSIYSISDGSFALVPVLNYSLSDNVDVMSYLNINLGQKGKTFSKNMGNGGLFRVRIYF
jgi:hypothetical protein